MAITGASGVVYGLRLLDYLLKEFQIELILSDSSLEVIKHETPELFDRVKRILGERERQNLRVYRENQLGSPTASGSYKTEGMFIVPCSMKTLSAIANGYADNLITRTADVVIKEGKKLIISPREMPLSAIHLENMLKLARLGVIIAPPIPGFYHRPEKIDDLIDFVVGKLLDLMGIDNNLYRRWNG